MIRRGSASRSFWRPLVGVAVAYAVAMQSLLVALGGFSLPAHADRTTAAFELCLHDQAAPALPAGNPGKSGCTHCIFCFAGSHHALVGSPPVLFHRLVLAFIEPQWAGDVHALPRASAYSIASPRGPPPRA